MQWKRRLAELAIIVMTTAFSVSVTEWMPFVKMVENWLSDYRIATLSPLQPQSPNIVIVTITEDTLEQFPYRSPLDRHFLATVLKTLEGYGAKAIGIDILFDQATETDKDDELKQTLLNLRIPVVVGFIGEQEGLSENQREYLADFVPADFRGYVTLIKDGVDATVRQIYPGRTDEDGQFLKSFPLKLVEKIRPNSHPVAGPIAWRGAPGNGSPPFRKFPAHTLKLMPGEWFKDKVVLVGAELTLVDRHRTPLAAVSSGYNLLAGIDIHAHAIDQLLSSRQPIDIPLAGKIAFTFFVSLVGVFIADMGLRLSVNISLAMGGVGLIWIAGFVLYHEKAIMIPLLMPTLALGGAWWAGGLQGSWRERRQRQFLKEAFSRYMSPSLVSELIADPQKLSLGGERREMTFLFTDVAGFTTLSETIEPGVLGGLLNTYFNGICHILIDQGATVIDFIGDAIFAIFGAPVTQSDHAQRAILCALKIQEFSNDFRQSDGARHWNWGETRIGVHSGFALVGNFGSDLKFKYAPVGDAVNTASRLEGLNKFFGTTLCLSEPSLAASGYSSVRPLGRIVMKGKSEPIEIFEPMSEEWMTSLDGKLYLDAYSLLAAKQTDEAKQAFLTLAERCPGDKCVRFHIDRIADGEVGDVIVMQQK